MPTNAHGNFQGRRLVVLGAGYVGGAVARSAKLQGMEVTALTRNAGKAAALQAEGIDSVVADLADHDWHVAMPERVDFVLNAVSSGGGGVEGYRHSYVEGMKSVIAWARSARPATLVYTGSTSVYPQDGGVEVDESSSTDPANERASLLLDAEQIAQGAASEDMRVFILRLAGIYGPDRHHLLDQIQAGEVLAGTGEHRLNLAHLDDIVSAILNCFEAAPTVVSGVFNVSDDHPVRKHELAAWISGRLGQPIPRFDPSLTGRRRGVMPDRLVINRKLKNTLGWRPRYPSFREGYETLLSR
jgi:nucleoside-diphosphate-sugar epimerase